MCVVFQKRIGVSCDRYSNLTCTTTIPLMGRGFADYFDGYLHRVRITSGGSGVVTLDTRSCLEGRPCAIFIGTRHTVVFLHGWYCVEQGSCLYIMKIWTNEWTICLVSLGERHCSGAYLWYVIYHESWMRRKFPESCG